MDFCLVCVARWPSSSFDMQINYSFSCLQCPNMYAEVDEKTGDTIQITKPIPLPALNVSPPARSGLACAVAGLVSARTSCCGTDPFSPIVRIACCCYAVHDARSMCAKHYHHTVFSPLYSHLHAFRIVPTRSSMPFMRIKSRRRTFARYARKIRRLYRLRCASSM